MKPVAVVPTLCTLANAFCGFLSIAKGADALAVLSEAGSEPGPVALAQFYHLMATACWLVFLAMVFDALDGRIARMTDQTSDFGAYLDSLTDMVTFGAAPALLVKFMFDATRHIHAIPLADKAVLILTVLYVCCAALRLARFTSDVQEQADAHDFFAGLPTPAAAGLLCSSILFYVLLARNDPRTVIATLFVDAETMQDFFTLIQRPLLVGMLLVSPLLGLLMISKVPYIHLVNRYMRGRRPYTYVAQILFIFSLLFLLEVWALFLGFFLFVLLCPAVVKLERLRQAKFSTLADKRGSAE